MLTYSWTCTLQLSVGAIVSSFFYNKEIGLQMHSKIHILLIVLTRHWNLGSNCIGLIETVVNLTRVLMLELTCLSCSWWWLCSWVREDLRYIHDDGKMVKVLIRFFWETRCIHSEVILFSHQTGVASLYYYELVKGRQMPFFGKKKKTTFSHSVLKCHYPNTT